MKIKNITNINNNTLYIENYIHDEKLTLNQFIELFLVQLNENNNTIYNSNKIQCKSGKTRSLGDIYLICKSYYPNVTKKQVKRSLLYLGNNLVGHYCPTIEKRVYSHKHVHPYWIQGRSAGFDEYYHKLFYLGSRGKL